LALNNFLQIHSNDNVLVALQELPIGTVINGVEIKETIPAKHKTAIKPLQEGDEILMYGVVVGKAIKKIDAGERIGLHNTGHHTQTIGKRNCHEHWQRPDVSEFVNTTFKGYQRHDGQAGTRNMWLVVPLVFCENRNIEILEDALLQQLGYKQPNQYKQYVQRLMYRYEQGINAAELLQTKNTGTASIETILSPYFKNLSGIRFLTHTMGCGGTRQDAATLCGLLAGYIHHPNVAGATVLSLGCQNAEMQMLEQAIHERNSNFNKPLYILNHQQYGSESNLLNEALTKTFAGCVQANELVRTDVSLQKLTLGVKCGGSDGFSGISANPVLGHVSDMLAAMNGKIIMAEFPELCGVEQELINRMTDDEISDRFLQLMQTYASLAQQSGSGFDMNPSPGNIKDGLITDAMKSAGAAKKGGTSNITDVLDYPNYAVKNGLQLLCTPGNDVQSVTAMVGSGANMVCFTTGLGTPTGNPIAPVMKLSSNNLLSEKMNDIIDFNAGAIVTGKETITENANALLKKMITVASGEPCKAELNEQYDFIPWQRGVNL
jgi:altronate hydrolase